MSESLKNLISERASSLPEARRGYDKDAVHAMLDLVQAR